jgi:glutaredoxin-like protein NrdH
LQTTVYTLPGSVCWGCRFTKRDLDKYGIPHETIPLENNPEALKTVKDLGYASAPVVVVDLGEGATFSFSGYSPSKLERVAELYAK